MPAPKDPVKYALWKERMSKARSGEKNANYGKKMSEEQKKKLSEAMTGKYSGKNNPMYGVHLTGEKNHNFGKPLSPETRAKISESRSGQTAWNKGKPSTWTKGIPRSDETKAKISASNIGKNHGRQAWNKGVPFSEESKQKMSDAKLGKQMSEEFKEKRSEIMKKQWQDPEFRQRMSENHSGENNPNYGIPATEERRKQMSKWAKEREDNPVEIMRQANLGRPLTEEHRTKISEANSGEKCHNWKGGVTPVYKHIRGHSRYKQWCADLLKKHDYTDAFTGHKGGLLACHHILPVNVILRFNNVTTIEGALACPLIWDLNNGVVILKYAHDKFHNIYGDDKNIYELTPEQIKELYQE